MKTYAIVGAGGFGREVIPQARLMLGMMEPDEHQLLLVDDAMHGQTVNGYPVISSKAFLGMPNDRLFSVAVASAETRREITERMISAGAQPFQVTGNNVFIDDSNEIGEGAIFCPFTIVTASAKIGKSFHANIYSYVAHDCVIGDYVTFAPGVKCNGNVHIDDYAYIGTGAIIKQGKEGKPLTIGKGAVIGMGAVVTKNVAPGVTVVGNPAKPLTRTGLGG